MTRFYTMIIATLVALSITTANAAAKLPVVHTYTPPLGVDAGCGKGKPVYTLGGKKFCQLPKSGK